MFKRTFLRAGVALAFGTGWSPVSATTAVTLQDFSDPAVRDMISALMTGDVATTLARARVIDDGVNAPGRNGASPLLIAVRRLDVRMVEALLKAGANPDGAPAGAPLHEAVKARDLTIARMLLNYHADPNGRFGKEPAIYEAALIGATEAADLLLTHGARVDEPNGMGRTGAIVAASADHWSMVGFLLGRGASPWAADRAGLTVGTFAVDSRVIPDSLEGKALAAVIQELRRKGYPWPPPGPRQVKSLREAGNWPLR